MNDPSGKIVLPGWTKAAKSDPPKLQTVLGAIEGRKHYARVDESGKVIAVDLGDRGSINTDVETTQGYMWCAPDPRWQPIEEARTQLGRGAVPRESFWRILCPNTLRVNAAAVCRSRSRPP
jgi:hypothetical protein